MAQVTHRQSLATHAEVLYRALKRSPCACGWHWAVLADGKRVRVTKTCQRCTAMEEYELSEYFKAPEMRVTP
jgi:hypothetical protein